MLNKTPMPERDPKQRATCFDEVALGYSASDAAAEAQRCLRCKKPPCVAGCPVNVNIPGFIEKIQQNDIEGALDVIKSTNALPAICGRVCPQETQCEQRCVRAKKGDPVGIGRLERYVADYCLERGIDVKHEGRSDAGLHKRAAIVGAGPAGLTCAGTLAAAGVDVTIYEAFHTSGGVLSYGIPEFRLPKSIVAAEVDALKAMGVEIKLNHVVGKVFTIDELLEQYDTVFIGTGAGLPSFMGIPGENACGVYSANEFLTRVNLMKAYKFPEYDTPLYLKGNVAVVGGGNVAMDAARCALRLGADKVSIVYRRTQEDMPARAEEIHHAIEEGVEMLTLVNPTRILSDENAYVTGMECVRMTQGEPDASGRRRPVPEVGSEFVLDVNVVIIAIGQSPNPLIKATTPSLETQKWGGIITDETTGATNIPHVYAGGDAVTGAATVIAAMGMGRAAAAAMLKDMGMD